MSKVERKHGELKDATIMHVSLVKKGANNMPFFAAKSGDVNSFNFEVDLFQKSATNEQKLLYGVVYTPNEVDAHGDFMSAETIEKCAHAFNEHYRTIDTEHNFMAGAGSVVESYIAPIDMDIDGTIINKGSWVLVTKASDESWEKFKSGEINGYSFSAMVRKVVSKGEPTLKNKISQVFKSLFANKSFDEDVANELDRIAASPDFIIGMLRDSFYKQYSWETSEKEKLEMLSVTLKEASAYAAEMAASKDTIVNKTDEPEVKETEEPVVDAAVVEPAPVVEDEIPADPEVKEEPEPETKKEEEPVMVDKSEEQKTDAAAIAASVLELIMPKISELINKSITEVDKKIVEVQKTIGEIDDASLRSAVRVDKSAGEEKKTTKPTLPGNGIL